MIAKNVADWKNTSFDLVYNSTVVEVLTIATLLQDLINSK